MHTTTWQEREREREEYPIRYSSDVFSLNSKRDALRSIIQAKIKLLKGKRSSKLSLVILLKEEYIFSF